MQRSTSLPWFKLYVWGRMCYPNDICDTSRWDHHRISVTYGRQSNVPKLYDGKGLLEIDFDAKPS